VHSFMEMGERDPSIIELGKDVWLKNLNAPGMDIVAERARRNMLLAGQIPEEQMTEDEIEFMSSQEPAPDPVAEALEREAEARDDEIQLKAIAEAREDRELEHKIDTD